MYPRRDVYYADVGVRSDSRSVHSRCYGGICRNCHFGKEKTHEAGRSAKGQKIKSIKNLLKRRTGNMRIGKYCYQIFFEKA